jgi:hypothetical protein
VTGGATPPQPANPPRDLTRQEEGIPIMTDPESRLPDELEQLGILRLGHIRDRMRACSLTKCGFGGRRSKEAIGALPLRVSTLAYPTVHTKGCKLVGRLFG